MSEPDGRWAQYMDDLRIGANVHTPLEVRGTLTRLAGLVLEAVGLRVPVGSQCLIANGKREPVLAEVVGFAGNRAFLMPAGDTRGLASGASVTPLPPYRTVPRLGQDNPPPSPNDRSVLSLPMGAGLLGRLSTEKLIFLGASTGGTEAIKEVLVHMPADSPAIVITQHMPPGFTTSFAARLNGLCQITVKEAVNGERILPGHAYIAPGGTQFHISRSGANYVAVVDDGPPVNRHKPLEHVLPRDLPCRDGGGDRRIKPLRLDRLHESHRISVLGENGCRAGQKEGEAGAFEKCRVFGHLIIPVGRT